MYRGTLFQDFASQANIVLSASTWRRTNSSAVTKHN